jgi:hypothetical protein
LCDQLWSVENDTKMRRVDVRIALALWFLATSADYYTIGHLVSRNQQFGYKRCVCCAIIESTTSVYHVSNEGGFQK